jgi:lipoprotein-releasing system permease protein
VVEALIIGLAGALAGFVLGYLLCLALGSIEIKSPFMDATGCRSPTSPGTT